MDFLLLCLAWSALLFICYLFGLKLCVSWGLNLISWIPNIIFRIPNDISGIPNVISGVWNNIFYTKFYFWETKLFFGVPNYISVRPNHISGTPNHISVIPRHTHVTPFPHFTHFPVLLAFLHIYDSVQSRIPSNNCDWSFLKRFNYSLFYRVLETFDEFHDFRILIAFYNTMS
jgi:hypothetical protein